MTVVLYEQRENLGVVTLNRPTVRNAMNTPMLARLLEVLDEAQSQGVEALIFTGADGTFSAGADVSEMVDDAGAAMRMDLFCRIYERISRYPAPTIAAIDGHCVGGGAEVASCCDLRVGTPSLRLRFPGASYGIPVGVARLPSLVGLSHAKDLLMTTRTIDGEEAYRMGFLNRLTGAEDLLEVAIGLAGSVAGNPGAMAQKRSLDEFYLSSERTAAENRGLRRWQSDAKGLMGAQGAARGSI